MNAYLRAEAPLQNKRKSLRQSGTKREFTQFFLSFSSLHPPKPLQESVAAPARAPNILKESSVGPYQGPPTSSTTEGKKRYALVSTVAAASLFSTALAHIYITAKRKKQGEKNNRRDKAASWGQTVPARRHLQAPYNSKGRDPACSFDD